MIIDTNSYGKIKDTNRYKISRGTFWFINSNKNRLIGHETINHNARTILLCLRKIKAIDLNQSRMKEQINDSPCPTPTHSVIDLLQSSIKPLWFYVAWPSSILARCFSQSFPTSQTKAQFPVYTQPTYGHIKIPYSSSFTFSCKLRPKEDPVMLLLTFETFCVEQLSSRC